MSTRQVWEELRALADLWLESELVQEFRSQLPSSDNVSAGTIPEVLRSIDAGTGLVSEEPLLPNKWELLAPQMPLVDLDARGVREFLIRMRPIGFAAEGSTAWLRSRLPGYPLIPVPHLAQNTHLTSPEICRGIGWRREALQGGLQFESAPRGAEMLGIPTGEYLRRTSGLARAMETTPEWKTFSELLNALTSDDRDKLIQARRALRERLTAELVGHHEPGRMLRRESYRQDQVESAVGGLSGRPRAFADAFENVSDLIDLASLRVLGQLVAYGGPRTVSAVDALEREGSTLRFSSPEALPYSALILIDDPLTPDAALVTAFSWFSDEAGVAISSYTAEVLSGAGTLAASA